MTSLHPRRLSRGALLWAALLGAALLGATAPPAAADDALPPAQKDAFEKLIHDYLLGHPEVLIEALQAAEDKMKEQADDRAKQAIAALQNDLLADPEAPVVGNPKGDVTLVEFFDYRCPYCKQVSPSLQALVKEDAKLRVVYKEFPVLGRESVFAARAALAARKQGKYEPFHNALMGLKGQLGDEVVLKTAGAVGIDVGKLKADMAAPDIEAQIRRNHELAQSLDIRGTPAFIVGSTLIPGAVDVATLRRKIAEARKPG
jgi:protein-disulfide isomerase